MQTGRREKWPMLRLMVILCASLPGLHAYAAPKAPTNLVATAVSTNQINLSWTDTANNEDGFKIERAPDSSGVPGTWVQIATVGANVTTYNDTSVSADAKYWYRVRAYNNGGDSAYSNEAIATTAPSTPSNLTTTAVSSSQIDLAWIDNSSAEDGFKIERAPDGGGSPGTWTQIATVATNIAIYSDTGLSPDTTYYYRVRAYNTGGDSGFSNIANALTPARCPTSLVGWGLNDFGQATASTGFSWAVDIAAGNSHSLAIRTDRTVMAWGDNTYGRASPPSNLTDVVAVSAGLYHSLALKGDGTVVGWGDNTYGQASVPEGLAGVVAIATSFDFNLALKRDGTVVGWGGDNVQASPPTNLTGVVGIAAGIAHSLAVRSDGTVVGWGSNIFGESTPPANLTGVVAVAAAGYHSLALKSDGRVVAWGDNGLGESSPPTNLTGVVAIAAGHSHGLALRNDGIVVGWGRGGVGQGFVPESLTGVVVIAAGAADSLALTCTPNAPSALTAVAVDSNRVELSWIDTAYTEEGFAVERSIGINAGVWTQIATLSSNATSYTDTSIVPDTFYHYRVRAFNASGSSGYSSDPWPIVFLLPPTDLTAVGAASDRINLTWTNHCKIGGGIEIERAPDESGVPGAWAQIAVVGTNVSSYANTGLATNSVYWYRLRVRYADWAKSPYSNLASARTLFLNPPSELAAVVVSTDQINLSWTDNSAYEDGFRIERALDNGGVPSAWTQIVAVGANVTNYNDVGLLANVRYWYRVRAYDSGGYSGYSNETCAFIPPPCPRYVGGWGYNGDGAAVPPTGLVWAVGIAAGYRHSLALRSDGTVIEWGYDNTTPPAGATGVVAIAAGSGHSLALNADGTVVGWGSNSYGQLTPPAGTTGIVAIAAGGDESLALKNDGILVVWGDKRGVSSLTGVVAMAAGFYHSLAVTSNGAVVGWGNNTYGQSTSPAGLTDVVAVAVGDYHSLALKSDGTVVGWGYNLFGQSTPPAGLSNVTRIAAGSYFSLTLKADGTIVAWGDNTNGQSTPPASLSNVVAIAAGGNHALALSLPCPLSAPSRLVATAIWPSQINLSWLDNSWDEEGFTLERAPDSGGSPDAWTQIATVTTNVTNYSDTTLSPGMTLWYRVWAHNATGDSDYSDPASATIPFVLAPSGLTAVSMSATQVNLSWLDNSSNEAGFNVERGLSLGTWTQITTIISNITTYSDMAAVDGVTNWYRVRAYDANGDSAYTAPASAVTPLASPTNLVVTLVSGNQINLSWMDRSASEDGFRIERTTSIQTQAPWVQIGATSTNVTVFSDVGLACLQTYYYRVRAFKGTGTSTFSNVGSANTGALDTDTDSIPDCWTLQYFGHPAGDASDGSRAVDDPDGDGLSNIQELLAGTIPTNSVSAFRIIAVAREGNDVRVTWILSSGHTSVLEAASIPAGPYTNLSANISNKGTGQFNASYLDLGAATNAGGRFYRVRLVP